MAHGIGWTRDIGWRHCVVRMRRYVFDDHTRIDFYSVLINIFYDFGIMVSEHANFVADVCCHVA